MEKMGIQLIAGVVNIVRKGEVGHYQQLLLFPQCFQKQSVVDVLKTSIYRVKGLSETPYQR